MRFHGRPWGCFTQDGSACPGRTSRGTADNAGLPDAMAPFGCGAQDPATHLRNLRWDPRKKPVGFFLEDFDIWTDDVEKDF